MQNDLPNTSDEQFDDLFRQAASGYEPSFDPEAWKRMEKKLDGEQWYRRFLIRFGVLEVAVILGVLLLLWGTIDRISPEQSSAKNRIAVVHSKENPSSNRSSSANLFPNTGSAESLQRKKIDTEENDTKTAESTIPRIPENSGTPLKSGDTESKSAVSNEKTYVTNTEKTKVNRPRSTSVRTSRIQAKRPSKRAYQSSVSTPFSTIRKSSSDTPSFVNPENQSIQPEQVVSEPIQPLISRHWQLLPVELSWQPPVLDSVAAEPVAEPVSVRDRWGVQLMASPDFTQVPGRKASSGIDVGLQVDYRIFSRWRVSAGAIYALKNYTASSYDYRPYEGYWQTYHRPNTIDAVCRMIDLPVSVTFDALRWKSTVFFVSAGSTSYLMLKENYQYQYASYQRDIEKVGGGSHWFATTNISIGLEKPVSPRIRLRIEPFVKIPMGGVGFGKVKLQTQGVFFSLRYTWPKPGK